MVLALPRSHQGAVLAAHQSAGIAARLLQAGERTRTADPLFTRQALYQLSYSGKMPEFTGSAPSAPSSTGSGTVIVLPVATNSRPSTSAFNRSGPPSLRSTTLAFVRVEVRGLIIVPSIRLTEAVYAPLTGRSRYVGECRRLASCLRCG